MYILFFFFFKQKTAYEMRISDWSSDVCSSDLVGLERRQLTVVLGDAPSPGDGIFRAKHVEKMCESRPEFVRQAADRIWTIADRKMLAEKPTAHSLVDGIESEQLRRDPMSEMSNTAEVDARGARGISRPAQMLQILRGKRPKGSGIERQPGKGRRVDVMPGGREE